MAWRGDTVSDVLTYLELDHRKLVALLRKLEGREHIQTKERMAEELGAAVVLHIDLVENILYPALVEGGEIHDRVTEGYSEHQILRLIVNELALMRSGTEEWRAKLSALGENIRQYAEAESVMLRKLRKTLSIATIRQLTDSMQNALAGYQINRPFIAHRAY